MRPAFRAPSHKRVTDQMESGAPAPQTTGAMARVRSKARVFFCANGASATRAAANNRGDGACLFLMVVPANAGTHSLHAHWDLLQESQSHFCRPPNDCGGVWVPAFAGTTPNVELASAPRNDDRETRRKQQGRWRMSAVLHLAPFLRGEVGEHREMRDG